jgi:hypothetical protein
MTTQSMKNEPAAAFAMAQVIQFAGKLEGSKASLTLAIRDLILEGVNVAAFFVEHTKTNKKGETVKDSAPGTAIWEKIAETNFALSLKNMDKDKANKARSYFIECARPAMYLASRGLSAVKVNKDGAFVNVPLGETVDLYTGAGERTTVAKSQVEREIESASIEGKELTDAQAWERVTRKNVATVGKAGVPTSTETRKRWAQGAIESGLCPAPEGRDRNRADDNKADDAINFLSLAFEVMETTDESPFAMTDEREAKLAKLAAMITATLN